MRKIFENQPDGRPKVKQTGHFINPSRLQVFHQHHTALRRSDQATRLGEPLIEKLDKLVELPGRQRAHIDLLSAALRQPVQQTDVAAEIIAKRLARLLTY